MSQAYVVCNQLQQFWGKKKAWVDGTDPRRILCNKHEDEAVNLLVELSARDIDLRGDVVEVELDEKNIPQVTASEHLIADPQPEPPEVETAAEQPEPTPELEQ